MTAELRAILEYSGKFQNGFRAQKSVAWMNEAWRALLIIKSYETAIR